MMRLQNAYSFARAQPQKKKILSKVRVFRSGKRPGNAA